MIILIIIVAVIIIVLVVRHYAFDEQEEEEAHMMLVESIQKKEEGKTKVKYDNELADMEAQYGKIANKISLSNYSLKDDIIVFHDTKNIWFQGLMIPYSSILSCSVSENQQIKKCEIEYNTSTSTGSMLGRAIVGGILTGGIDAILGAATAGKDTIATSQDDKVIHDYTVFINTNDSANPVLNIACGDDGVLTNNIVGLMNAVISHKG